MNKTWKWILGIVLVLALIGGMFAIGYFWQSRAYGMMPGLRGQYETFGPEWGERGWSHPMMNDRGGYAPMMAGQCGGYAGYSHHFGGFFPLGGLLNLVLFVGLLYGAYWLGRRNARVILDPAPGAPVSGPPAPVADPAPASPEADSPPTPGKRARKTE